MANPRTTPTAAPRLNDTADHYTPVYRSLVRARDLTHAEFRLLVLLHTFDLPQTTTSGKSPRRKWHVFVSVEQLADAFGCNALQVTRLLKSLETKGYIHRERRAHKTSFTFLLCSVSHPSRIGIQEGYVSSNDMADISIEDRSDLSLKDMQKNRIEKQKGKREVPLPSGAEAPASADGNRSTPKGKKSTKAQTAKSEKDTDPRVKTCIDRFCSLHQEAIGSKYHVSGAKDGATFKQLLADFSSDELATRLQAFFRDPDPWLSDKPRSVGMFASRVNRYAPKLARSQASRSPQLTPFPELTLEG